MSRWLAILATLAVASFGLLLSACGDEDEPTTTAAAEESETGESDEDGEDTQRVVIEAENGAFDAKAIFEAAAPGVVTITSVIGGAEEGTPDLFDGGGVGQGSGFVISDEGEIVTNAHVVTDAEQTGATSGPLAEAREVYVQFSDRNQVEAEIVGVDPFADVALLKVDPEGIDLNPLPLGSENDVEVGEGVAAIGSPFGEEQSLSVGVVSAANRNIGGLTRFGIEGALQTDASINPGNSGGPLLDSQGEVVGINQQIQTSSGGNQGVGYALPIDLAERSVEELREDGEVSYAYAGVTTQALYPQAAERLGIPPETTGAVVAEVQEGSPADEAGLRAGDEIRFQAGPLPVDGDVITAVDGEPVVGESDLARLVSQHSPGDEVELEVLRGGETIEVTMTLGDRADATR
jgi:S1-C subfamily serine protease